MIKRKMKWHIVVFSILLGIVFFAASHSSFAEEEQAGKVQTFVAKTPGEVQNVTPEAGKEIPVKPASHFNKAHAKEKVKANARPENIEASNFNLTEIMTEKSIEKFNEYVLGPEDRLKVIVFGEAELTGDYRVGSDGTIAFPLIGDINVEGLTLRQAEEIIETKLKEGYLKKPSVSIEVSESRPFYILGEVRRPGSYNYVAGMSVLQAVAISGGFTYRANRKNVEILRGNDAPAEPMNVTSSEKVKPGDIIFIQERFF